MSDQVIQEQNDTNEAEVQAACEALHTKVAAVLEGENTHIAFSVMVNIVGNVLTNDSFLPDARKQGAIFMLSVSKQLAAQNGISDDEMVAIIRDAS